MAIAISQPSQQSLLVTTMFNKTATGTATAFVAQLNDIPFLITNRHVVTGLHQDTNKPLDTKTAAIPNTLRVAFNSALGLGLFTEHDLPLLTDDVPLWIEHPSRGASVDMVALALPKLPDIVQYPYKVDASVHTTIEPGSIVRIIGFPFGEKTGASFAVWSTGFVASEPEIDHGGLPVFLVDCRSRQGQSGSPVIDYSDIGCQFLEPEKRPTKPGSAILLGVYSGRINAESDLGYVWKTYVLAELLLHAMERTRGKA